MPQRFKDQTVLITGASSGIGAATAKEFAREGANLVLIARRQDKLGGVAREIRALGAEVLAIEADVRDRAALDAAVRAAVDRFGALHVVLANAGYGVTGDALSLDTKDYRAQFDTNVFGLMDTAHAALPELLKTRGRLGLVASIMGFMAAPAMAPYCSSKFAVIGFAESLYYDLLPRGISVTCIKPGIVESEIRSVNNDGIYTGKPDPAPAWITQPSSAAAREIVHALYRRKPEHVVTGHGKIIAFLVRHFPRLTRAIFRTGAKRMIRTPLANKPSAS